MTTVAATAATTSPFPTALSPIAVGSLRLRNRIVMPAHTLLFGEDHLLSDRHIAYYRERAMGGTGLICAEGGAVHEESRGAFQFSISAYEERAIPQYAKLADACHEHGAAVITQLFSLGVHMLGTYDFDSWVPLWAPSRVPSIRDRETPVPMGPRELRTLVDGMALSARNVERAGLDGAEIHAAHSYLLGTFMSPAYNRRTDEYGGSVENRIRLILECAAAMREATRPGFVVGVRLSFDEWLGEHGITPEDSEEALELMAASGLFDYVNISGGGYHSMFKAVAPMGVEEGHLVPLGERAKAVVGDRARVMIVGRISTLETAERILAAGSADLVCMTRAHMVDPFLVKKAEEGRARETQLCVAANECFVRGQKEIACMMNPVLGRERRWGAGTLLRAAAPRRVVVVGAGPAGLRAASVAASRGHDVLLLEAAAEVGGHLNVIKRLPTRSLWQRAIDNLRIPCETAGVELRLGTRATLASVLAERPDAVVVATGAGWAASGFTPLRPDRDTIPGAVEGGAAGFVLDVETAVARALAHPGALGERVLIYDETGMYLPLGLAEVAAAHGAQVDVVTPDLYVGATVLATSEQPYLFPRLAAAGVTLTAQCGLEAIGPDGEATLVHAYGGRQERRAYATVVLSQYRVPREELWLELGGTAHGVGPVTERGGPELHRIGDCLAPRRTAVAIYEGERLGREL